MKTVYQYIEFVEQKPKPKTKVWSVQNRRFHDELGQVLWYSAWRRYCFAPTCPAWYSEECLDAIIKFLVQADRQHEIIKAERQKERGAK